MRGGGGTEGSSRRSPCLGRGAPGVTPAPNWAPQRTFPKEMTPTWHLRSCCPGLPTGPSVCQGRGLQQPQGPGSHQLTTSFYRQGRTQKNTASGPGCPRGWWWLPTPPGPDALGEEVLSSAAPTPTAAPCPTRMIKNVSGHCPTSSGWGWGRGTADVPPAETPSQTRRQPAPPCPSYVALLLE